jgi:hypothetical protein
MESNIVRSAVLVLAVAGFSASSLTSASTRAANTNKDQKAMVVPSVVASPTPMCPPNQPDGCGIH